MFSSSQAQRTHRQVLGDPEARLAGLGECAVVPPPVVELERRLLVWRSAFRSRVLSGPLFHGFGRPGSMPRLGREPFVASLDPLSDSDLLAEAGEGLLDATALLLPSMAAVRSRLSLLRKESPERARSVVETWVRASWEGTSSRLLELSSETGASTEALCWGGLRVAQPFLEALAEVFDDSGPAAADRGVSERCPCCGGPPGMARYGRGEGRRSLWCPLCDLEWTFPRITCPFCLTTDPQKLGYLSVENAASHRIDLCEVCHRYLRAIDERALPDWTEPDLLREEIATFYLCALARAKGFEEQSPWLCARPTFAQPASLVEQPWQHGEVAVDFGP